LGQLVIDVLKLNGLGIIAAIAAGHAADAVRPHPFKGRAAPKGAALRIGKRWRRKEHKKRSRGKTQQNCEK